MPVRKRKAMSPVAGSSAEDTVSRQQSALKPRGGGCIYCGLSSQKQRKGGKLEPLIRCKDCPTTGKPHIFSFSLSCDSVTMPMILQFILPVWITVKNLSRKYSSLHLGSALIAKPVMYAKRPTMM